MQFAISKGAKRLIGAASAAVASVPALAADYTNQISGMTDDVETNGGAIVLVVIAIAAVGVVIGLVRRGGR